MHFFWCEGLPTSTVAAPMQATETGGLPSNPQSRAFLVWPLSTCSLPYEYLGLDIPFLGRRFGGVLMASCGVRWCGHVLVLSASFPTYTQPWPKINVSCDNGQPRIQVLCAARPRHWHTYQGYHIPEQRLMGPQFFPPRPMRHCVSILGLFGQSSHHHHPGILGPPRHRHQLVLDISSTFSRVIPSAATAVSHLVDL